MTIGEIISGVGTCIIMCLCCISTVREGRFPKWYATSRIILTALSIAALLFGAFLPGKVTALVFYGILVFFVIFLAVQEFVGRKKYAPRN